MGIGSKLKKAVKKASKAVTTVAKAPLKVAESVVKGDLSQAAKEAGKGFGANANLFSGGAVYGDAAENALRSNTVNMLTFNTGREIANVGAGFNQLQNTGEADSRFYQDFALLGAKGLAAGALGAAAATKSNYLTAQAVKSGVETGNVGQVIGAAGGLDSSGWLNTIRSFLPQSNLPSLDMSPGGDGSYYYEAPTQGGSSTMQLFALSAVAVGVVFLIKKSRG